MKKIISGDIKVGLVGNGEHGSEVLLPVLLNIPGIQIVGICDLVEKRAMVGASLAHTKNWFSDYETMFHEIQLDAVVLAGPPQMHYSAALAAINRGIHVFVEKPPAVSKDEVSNLARLSSEKGVITGVGLNFRFSDPILQIKQYISDHSLTPVYIAVKHISSKPKTPFWGLDSLIKSFMLAQAIHPIDTILHLGGRLKSTDCKSYTDKNSIVVSANFEFENGCIGYLFSGTNSLRFQNYLEIATKEDVSIQLENLWQLKISDNSVIPDSLSDKKRWGIDWAPSPLSSGYSRAGYYNEFMSFFNCIRDGQMFSPSLKDAIEIYNVMESLEEQIITKRIQFPL